MSGHIQRRGAKSWRLKFEADRATTDGRRIRYVTVHGTINRAISKRTFTRRI
jgi:hypothetical protein